MESPHNTVWRSGRAILDFHRNLYIFGTGFINVLPAVTEEKLIRNGWEKMVGCYVDPEGNVWDVDTGKFFPFGLGRDIKPHTDWARMPPRIDAVDFGDPLPNLVLIPKDGEEYLYAYVNIKKDIIYSEDNQRLKTDLAAYEIGDNGIGKLVEETQDVSAIIAAAIDEVYKLPSCRKNSLALMKLEEAKMWITS